MRTISPRISRLLLLLIPAAPQGILVRHAEREGGGMATDETPDDAASKHCWRLLADAGVKRIFTSEVSRTQQTAERLVKKRGYPAGRAHRASRVDPMSALRNE
jgi:broad specificity phosphatase PhoE